MVVAMAVGGGGDGRTAMVADSGGVAGNGGGRFRRAVAMRRCGEAFETSGSSRGQTAGHLPSSQLSV